MQKSETIGELAKALSKAQASMGGATKDKNNPFFKHKYADLSSVWQACKDELTKNGLSVVQTNEVPENGEGVIVETTLLHISGEWITGRLLMKPTKADPQGIGLAITYARRYALAAMVGVCPEDDDANDASGKGDKKKKETEKKDEPLTLEGMLETINGFKATPHAHNWKKKYAKEVGALCADDKTMVSDAWYAKLAELKKEVANV